MNKQNTVQSYSSMPHILVVDDDRRIRDLVSRYLHGHGFVVMEAEDTKTARALMAQFSFDVLAVDVMMPGESGIEFTRDVRAQYETPIILLTALNEVHNRIEGLESGADDYLAKPFDPKELVLRLQAILRRTSSSEEHLPSFYLGKWQFDPVREELSDGENILNITSMELTLLKALAKTPGHVVSREQLAEICGADSQTRAIDVQVTRLRRKIEEDTKNPRYIQTVRGKGYILRVDSI